MTTFTAICGKVCLSLGFCKQEHIPGRPLEMSIASECVTLVGNSASETDVEIIGEKLNRANIKSFVVVHASAF